MVTFLKPKIYKDAEKLAEEISKVSIGKSYSSMAIALAMAIEKMVDVCDEDLGNEMATNQLIVFHTYYRNLLDRLGMDLIDLDEHCQEYGAD